MALIWPTRLSWASIFSTLFLVPEYPEQGIQPMLDVSNRRTTVIRKNLQNTLSIQYPSRPHSAREGKLTATNNLERKKKVFVLFLSPCLCFCFVFIELTKTLLHRHMANSENWILMIETYLHNGCKDMDYFLYFKKIWTICKMSQKLGIKISIYSLLL